MKTGRSLSELAAEIGRQSSAKRDLIAPTSAIVMGVSQEDGQEKPHLLIGSTDNIFGINEVAHDQIGAHLAIPGKYYDRMRNTDPQLLAHNVNTWLQRSTDKRLVRTLDGTMRAFLSDKYRPLENIDLAEAVLPVLADQQLEVLSCEITERRFYLKAVDQRINKDIPRGHRMGDGSHCIFDTLAPAIIISNSEVGAGALSIETGIWTKACTNMAVFAEAGMKRRHVGARHELADGIMELLSDETRRSFTLDVTGESIARSSLITGDNAKAALKAIRDAALLLSSAEAAGGIAGKPASARVVELRFFGGLQEEEIAEVLRVSTITVKRDWKVARAWLIGRLQPPA